MRDIATAAAVKGAPIAECVAVRRCACKPNQRFGDRNFPGLGETPDRDGLGIAAHGDGAERLGIYGHLRGHLRGHDGRVRICAGGAQQ